MKTPLLISALAIMSICTGFYYGTSYSNVQLEAARQEIQLLQIHNKIQKALIDLLETEIYICETGINPKDKLDGY